MNTFQSSINFLNDEEIDIAYNSRHQSIIKKLIDYSKSDSNEYEYEINKFGETLAGIDYNASEKKYPGIYYSKKKNNYSAEKTIKGVKYFIKNSVKYEVVEKAYLDFCREHNLDPHLRTDKNTCKIQKN